MNDELRSQEIRAALEDAAACLGKDGIPSLADSLCVSKQHLYSCIKTGEVPALLAKKIETITNGSVTRFRLNPRVFG